jgi:hypothetical protein
MKKHYIGGTAFGLRYFSWDIEKDGEGPLESNCPFKYAIGPFVTKRAALWAEKYGLNNPHFQHVRDAERLSRLNY